MFRSLAATSMAVLSVVSANAEDVPIVTPPCAHPAPLHNQYDGSPGYFVGFRSTTVDPKATAAILAKKYHFDYQQYWGGLFIRSISPVTIAELRCSPEIEYVEFNAQIHITAPAGSGT